MEVYDWYGVGDTGAIAGQGPDRSGMHVMEDAQFLELLDVDGQPVGLLYPLVPKRADSGNLVGALRLESLSLDFNRGVTDLRPGVVDENGRVVESPIEHLGELLTLRHLSLDGTPILARMLRRDRAQRDPGRATGGRRSAGMPGIRVLKIQLPAFNNITSPIAG